MKNRRQRKERKRRPTGEEIAKALRYPRSDIEAWIAGHISTSELCDRFGFEGQSAVFFRDQIRREVTEVVFQMRDSMERYLASRR